MRVRSRSHISTSILICWGEQVKLTIVGSLAYDSIGTDTGAVDDVLGGSAIYAGFAAAGHLARYAELGTPEEVGLVGVVGADFLPQDMARLESAGLELDGISQVPGKTFRWRGLYAGDKSQAQTLVTDLNVFETFDPKLPESLMRPRITFCANMHPRVQMKVFQQSQPSGFSAVDSMNLWITTTKDELSELLRSVDMLILNDDEVRMLGGERDLLESAEAIRSGEALSKGREAGAGPSMIIIKRGAGGVLALTGEGAVSLPGFPVIEVVDPTGCGDSFAGAMLAHLAGTGSGLPTESRLSEALIHANVTASFTLESFGVDALENLDPQRYSRRIEEYSSML